MPEAVDGTQDEHGAGQVIEEERKRRAVEVLDRIAR